MRTMSDGCNLAQQGASAVELLMNELCRCCPSLRQLPGVLGSVTHGSVPPHTSKGPAALLLSVTLQAKIALH